MQLHEITLLTVVSVLEFLQSAANTKYGYTDFTSQNYRRDDRQRRVILYRPIRNNNYQDEKTLYINRHPSTAGRVPYQSNQDAHRYTSQNEYNRWNRIPFNDGPDSNRQYDRRLGYGYPNNYDTQRKQNFHHDREQSIADYVKRFNFENHPRTTFYNGPNDSNFNQPIEEEIIIEEEPDDYKQLTHNFPSSNSFPTDSVHKDLTKATFPVNGPSSGSFANKYRFPTGNKPTHEEHKHLYYEKPDFDTSYDTSNDKDIDPEFLEIYKKVIEAYTKKQKQKKRQGNKPFYFGKQEKNNAKPLFFLPQNDPHGYMKEKIHFNSEDGSKSNFPMPRNPNSKGFVFPGPVQTSNKQATPYSSFQASPQFHKYSEPDPLYHPNGNPFELHDTSYTLPVPTPLPQVTTTSTIAPRTDIPQQSTTEKSQNFPDSINAQLPPPEKDADTNIPYVAATIVTPQTSMETTSKTATEIIQTPVSVSVSESSTMESVMSTLDYRNVSSKLYNKLLITQVANITSSSVLENETHSGNLTVEEETSPTTVSATGQPELFFLPTAAEEISGSSSKETPIFQETVYTSEDPNKPTTYRRNYSPPAPVFSSNIAVSTTSVATHQNEDHISNHSIPLPYNMGNADETQNMSTKNVQIGDAIGNSEKKDDILHDVYTKYNNEQHNNEYVFPSDSPAKTQRYNTDILPTAEATTIICKNITAMNATSQYKKQEHLENYSTTRQEESSETTESDVENIIENHKINENNVITSPDKEHKNDYFTNSTDNKKQYHTTQQNFLTTYKPDSNIHYIMSIINQARTHVILSQNGSHAEKVSL